MSADQATAQTFYDEVLSALKEGNIPFLVGGTFAYTHYTGIIRPTKDFDLFIKRDDYDRIASYLETKGFTMEIKFPVWIGKAHKGEESIDFIYGSGNGVGFVDDQWFANAAPATLLGYDVLLVPPEELIWQKALIMERERYDGADVAHMLDIYAPKLDWNRLVSRFGDHYRVLLSHTILYGFIYPSRRSQIPVQIMNSLIQRLYQELSAPDCTEPICNGTILSRQQYLDDVTARGMIDARLKPHGVMTPEDVALATAGIAIDGAKT
jgi:hypothetical protein